MGWDPPSFPTLCICSTKHKVTVLCFSVFLASRSLVSSCVDCCLLLCMCWCAFFFLATACLTDWFARLLICVQRPTVQIQATDDDYVEDEDVYTPALLFSTETSSHTTQHQAATTTRKQNTLLKHAPAAIHPSSLH